MSSATRTTDDAFQDVLLALFQLHGRVLEAADAMSGGFGLTGARWQVMKVAARQSLTVSQIARRLGPHADPRLLLRSREVEAFGTAQLQQLIVDMFDTMRAADGAGLWHN